MRLCSRFIRLRTLVFLIQREPGAGGNLLLPSSLTCGRRQRQGPEAGHARGSEDQHVLDGLRHDSVQTVALRARTFTYKSRWRREETPPSGDRK